MKIVSIVEGDGEVPALPVLLRRLGYWLTPEVEITILPPIRVRKDQFLNREDVFTKQLLLAALKAGDDGWILVLLDADDDCPATVPAAVAARVAAVIPHRRVSVVYANREFESWFIAGADSLNGKRGFRLQEAIPDDPDSIRGAKEWISAQIPAGRYHEVTDQPAFSAAVDLEIVRAKSRSFRKIIAEWTKNVV